VPRRAASAPALRFAVLDGGPFPKLRRVGIPFPDTLQHTVGARPILADGPIDFFEP